MNVTNSFFFVSGFGALESRFRETPINVQVDYESWVYPLDKLNHPIMVASSSGKPSAPRPDPN